MEKLKSNRGRPTKTIQSIQINLSIPEDLYAQVKLHLWSEVEGKVPHGAQSEFVTQLIREFFDGKRQ